MSRCGLISVAVCRTALAACAVVALSGCAQLLRDPAPPARAAAAELPDMPPEARALDLARHGAMEADYVQALIELGPSGACDQRAGRPVHCVLIISGGGGFGAYGAGVLSGWTASGERPVFNVVTGVSTGALMAPFAFLGSAWDEAMTEAYTTVEGDDDFLEDRGPLSLINGESVFDTEGFADRLEKYITADLLKEVAAAHAEGRRLYVGTTNLDAQRFTIWNMGAIAASEAPGALALFRLVLRASASPPIVAPPVLIPVTLDGVVYDEMHVDGGVQAQFFGPHEVVDVADAYAAAEALGAGPRPIPRFFVLRNHKFRPEPEAVPRILRPIGRRAISTMVLAMGRADLDRLFAVASNYDSDFYYTEIPEAFRWNSEEEFDQEEMKRLFEVGLDAGERGQAIWSARPPGMFARNAGLQPPSP